MSNAGHATEKPRSLRVIFGLNAVMMVLPLVFYAVVTARNIDLGGLNPTLMLYTAAAYTLSFAVLVFCIRSRNGLGVRAVILLNVVIALPAKAYIGIAVAIVSMVLTFRSANKRYFGQAAHP